MITRVAVPLEKLPGGISESNGKELSSLGLGIRHVLGLKVVGRIGRWRSISAELAWYRSEWMTANLAVDVFGRSRRSVA